MTWECSIIPCDYFWHSVCHTVSLEYSSVFYCCHYCDGCQCFCCSRKKQQEHSKICEIIKMYNYRSSNYIQNIQSSPLSISTTWCGPHMLMNILDRTKYQRPLGVDQMSCKPCLTVHSWLFSKSSPNWDLKSSSSFCFRLFMSDTQIYLV